MIRQSKLRELADPHRLCLGLLGLEKMGTRGCFGLQVKSCLGACVGREDRAAHDARLLSALADLKVHAWPFADAIELIMKGVAHLLRIVGVGFPRPYGRERALN